MSLGIIKSIEEIDNWRISALPIVESSKAIQVGVGSLINTVLGGYSDMEGYIVTTEEHTVHVLIDNQSSCCEDFGYLSSDDDLSSFVGAELIDIELTDMALNTKMIGEDNYNSYDDGGGIQFVNFQTDRGTFQLAVYNYHNGYYGHSIVVAKDMDIVLSDVL